MPVIRSALSVAILTLLLGGCASSFPLQPASVGAFTTPVPIYPPRPDQVQHASLEIATSDVDLAARRASRLTAEYGGRLLDSYSWEVNGRRSVSLEIEVPGDSFEGLYSALRKLGRLNVDNRFYDGVLQSRYPYDTWMARITLMILPSGSPLRPPPFTAWDPAVTLQRALAVFLKIFGFLVDILIWVVVVAGPFLLMGLAAWWIFRRLRRPPSGDQENS